MLPLQCSAGVVELALGNAAGPGSRWYVAVAVYQYQGDFQWWSHYSASTVNRALPVCEWPALGMLWATARSNAASAVLSRHGGACIGCCGRTGQEVVCCWVAVLLDSGSFPAVEPLLGIHSAQSPASV